MFNIVLVSPQIPPNTGNIARLCAGMELTLHLVGPLGFSLEDRYLKRAGLDYWPHVKLVVYNSFEAFQKEHPQAHCYFFSTKSTRSYLEATYQVNDFLVFGSETSGLSEEIRQLAGEKLLTIPMTGKIRSLNLSSSVAMVVGEALRQIRQKSV